MFWQVAYSGKRLEGFGLSDGEVMERLWSYLRPTSKITKEMTPSHRVDTLTDVLVHYAKKSISNLGVSSHNMYLFQVKSTKNCYLAICIAMKITSIYKAKNTLKELKKSKHNKNFIVDRILPNWVYLVIVNVSWYRKPAKIGRSFLGIRY